MKVFAKGICESCKKLNEGKDFRYVTFACNDGKLVEAHKVILAASSPLFQNLLKRSKHPHPFYMRGIKLEDLLSILDFMFNV